MLAAAGLRRLGFASRISLTLPATRACRRPARASSRSKSAQDDDARAGSRRANRRCRTRGGAARRRARRGRSARRRLPDADRRAGGCRVGSDDSSSWPSWCRSTAAASFARTASGTRATKRPPSARASARELLADGRRRRSSRRRARAARRRRVLSHEASSIVYLDRRRPGRPGPHHRARPAVSRSRPTSCCTTTSSTARLLRHARPDAEKIDVGVAAPQPLEQEAICYLLAEKAREGKTVARLKWGDPFVFDQRRRRSAVPARAGRALRSRPRRAGRHRRAELRGHSDHLSGRRRHADVRPRPRRRRQDASASVDWASLARLDGTIVCYAGPQQLPHILERAARRTAGRRTTPRRSSTTARCRRSRRLAGIARRDRRRATARVRRPAAGGAGRRPRRRRCASTCAGSTHGRCSASACSSRGRASRRPSSSSGSKPMGAEAIEAPMIRIAAAGRLRPAGRGVRAGGRRSTGSSSRAPTPWTRSSSGCSPAPRDLRALGGVKLCAVGPATAERLARHGLKVDLIAGRIPRGGGGRARSRTPATCAG